ncbi:hypothetical protein O6H91_16G036800 [Diphasiastrum complanatum]|uniref:Uncharacterized protein n=1 Tax=Diphasiastrum complanatum TaxID=34168 RepID=A0ACC2BBE1_DIPCM|nr:hypothetical protein O6H91_16G036800 [Diphasiastrum complanatum]
MVKKKISLLYFARVVNSGNLRGNPYRAVVSFKTSLFFLQEIGMASPKRCVNNMVQRTLLCHNACKTLIIHKDVIFMHTFEFLANHLVQHQTSFKCVIGRVASFWRFLLEQSLDLTKSTLLPCLISLASDLCKQMDGYSGVNI